jgi:hypothetical protein
MTINRREVLTGTIAAVAVPTTGAEARCGGRRFRKPEQYPLAEISARRWEVAKFVMMIEGRPEIEDRIAAQSLHALHDHLMIARGAMARAERCARAAFAAAGVPWPEDPPTV